ncbi:hypothetical protein CFC21_089602 [Triticum aestivum]|uniref:Protein kinase domain-containing protein n=2 Tax=Triticum aestivum TaxID=4565 RepID=A0A9R1IMW5_WHEAT|nr:wall-associated receptor kinase 2-like isoform X1 [Triticum aestivum]KAF7086297.1 hypothetical protein CFC21_089602 [Triticum aestivum]
MASHNHKPESLLLACLGAVFAARLAAVAGAPAQPSSDCQSKCGDIDVPFPFGIGPECAMPGFNLTCDDVGGRRALFHGNVEIVGLPLERGQARMMNVISSACYNATSGGMKYNDWQLNLTNTPYRLSDTDNKFTAVGCRTLAYISDERNTGKYMSGCVAMCRRGEQGALRNGPCSGIGCCQTAIPGELQFYRVWFDPSFNTTEIHNVSRCSYAVLMESSNFTFFPSYATSPEFNDRFYGRAKVVVDWAIGNETCEVARVKRDSYACVSDNSECFNSANGPGYICNCTKGFHGNPYLKDPAHGCIDIDECVDLQPYPCSVRGSCKNLPGRFECVCPDGYTGDAKNGTCESERPPRNQTLGPGAKLAIGASVGILVGLVGFLGVEVIRHKRSIKREALNRQSDEYFKQHGGEILAEMTRDGHGRSIPFTVYTRDEIEAATDSFKKANIVGEGGQGTVYKAVLRDTAVAVKRCKEVDESRTKDFVQELVILCRLDHPNIVKLLGCCLQYEAPILVYEFVPNRTLQELLHPRNQRCCVTLGTRLKIAAQSAGALAHLHSAERPILHGDVKPANILLGDGWVAKVSDFGCSTIDEITQVVPKGTPGYLDPEYLLDYQLTVKNDVYSFGVVLIELLTGKKPLSKERKSLTVMFQESMADGTLHQLLDRGISDEANMAVILQVAELASQCLLVPGASRPAMRLVAEKLRRLADGVQEQSQLPLVLEDLSPMGVGAGVGSSTSTLYTTNSQTTGYFSLEKKTALSIEYAR